VEPRLSAAAERVAAFRALHRAGCFVLPNPWDVGSARALVSLGFRALATTSSGFAWSQGLRDNHISLEQALAHFRALAAAVPVPLNADFEGGFATAPEGVAANVARAAATGVSGLSIEDSTGDPSAPLFELPLAVERVRAAREAIDAGEVPVLLTGRSEGFIAGRPDLDATIRRLVAYKEAGAECLYAPGLRTSEEFRAVVEAVAPNPVNALVHADFATVEQLAGLGVRRISVGGALARSAWTGFLAAAREIQEQGTFGAFGRAITTSQLEPLLDGPRGDGPRGDDGRGGRGDDARPDRDA
jgi:methylisocitrate lyase